MAQKASGLVTSEVDASQQMMSKSQFSKQIDFASTTAALSTGLTRRQTTSTSKMASSSEMKSVSSHQVCELLKQNLKFSFEPKTDRKYFCISALASKMGQIKKVMAHYHAN